MIGAFLFLLFQHLSKQASIGIATGASLDPDKKNPKAF